MDERPPTRARALWRRGGDVLGVQAAGIALAVVVPVVLARLLGASGFGAYATVLAWVQVLARIPTLGLDTSVLRFVPSYARTGDIGSLGGFVRFTAASTGATAALAALALALTSVAFPSRVDHVVRETVLAGAVLLGALPLLHVVVGALRAVKQPVRAQLLDGTLRPAGLAIVVLAAAFVVHDGLTPARAMLAHGGIAIALVGLGTRWVLDGLPRDWRSVPSTPRPRGWLRASVPMLVTGLLQALLQQFDILVVGALLGAREAGLYAVGSRLARLVVLGQRAVNTIGAPLIAEHHAAGELDEVGRIARATALGAFVCGAAVAAVLLAGQQVALSLFGAEFVEARIVLAVLVVGQLVNVATGPVGYLLDLTGHQDALAKLTAAIVLGAAIAMPGCIHLLGKEGAAAVAAIAVAARNLGALVLVRRYLGVSPSIAGVIRHGYR